MLSLKLKEKALGIEKNIVIENLEKFIVSWHKKKSKIDSDAKLQFVEPYPFPIFSSIQTSLKFSH